MKNKILLQKFALAGISAIILVLSCAGTIFAQSQLPAPKQEKLLNGLKILMWSDARADKVSVTIRINAGSAFDPQGKEGAMQLLADNLFPNDASREFFADDLGGGLEVVATYDFVQITASSKPVSFLTMLETLSAAISNPAIDKETTAKVRNALLAKLKILEADPAYVADQAVAKRLFGTFPYGRPQRGSTASVQKLDFADLIDAKSRFLTADNATMAISGNFDRNLAFKAVRRYFGSWLKSDKKVPSTFRQPDPPVATVWMFDSPKQDSFAMRYAMRSVARNDKDLGASEIFTSIIGLRLRSRFSTAYDGDIFIRNEVHALPGMIMIGFGGKMNRASRAEIDAMIVKTLSENITEAEFQTAKQGIQAEWSKKDIPSLWLDADTFNIMQPEASSRVVDTVTLDEVRSYAAKFSKLPIAAVLVEAPPPGS